MRAEDCALVILASGLSGRFGEADKLMAALKGKPMVQHVIDTAKPLAFAERFAVIPTASKQRRSLFTAEGFTLIENPDPALGQGCSLKLAAEAVMAKGHKALCLMLGDMPFIERDDLINLLNIPIDKDRAISYCNHLLIPPVIFTNGALEELSKIDSSQGAKALFNSANTHKHPLSERAAQDIDTPEALAKYA